MKRPGYVYFLTNKGKTVLYIGVTSDLPGRLQKHIDGVYRGFAYKYGCRFLIYYEHFDGILDAIDREKQLKGWRRQRKEDLINSKTPGWKFLNDEILKKNVILSEPTEARRSEESLQATQEYN